MKKQLNNKQPERLSARLITGAALFAAIGICPGNAIAQVMEERTHVYKYEDIKHYTMDILPLSGTCVLAGTVFDPNNGSDNAISQLQVQNYLSGSGSTFVKMKYDDAGYDERAVGTHFVDGKNGDIVIVAMRRDLQNGTQDRIEILRTDQSGTLGTAFTVTDVNGSNEHMYPMGTLVKGTDLYICGYTTPYANTAFPAEPQYNTHKQIFVLKYDLGNNVVMNSLKLDYQSSHAMNDYDMAMRMKFLSNGRLLVTGSCNVENPNFPGLTRDYPDAYSGTLFLTFDPDLANPQDNSFSEFRLPAGLGPIPNPTYIDDYAEYGFDVQEDRVTGGYFVFGNRYVAQPGLEPLVTSYSVTYLDNLFYPPAPDNRMWNGLDNNWGVNTVPGNSNNTVVMSGYQSARPWWLNSPYPTAYSNINPFLEELTLAYNGSQIQIGRNYHSVILSNEGTGFSGTYSNAYNVLGGYFSTLAWTPPNTVRDPLISPDILLSAPIWNPDGYNKLNMKIIRTNRFGVPGDCPSDQREDSTKKMLVSAWENTLPFTETEADFAEAAPIFSIQSSGFDPDRIPICRPDPVFKPTGINSQDAAVVTVAIGPNPAHDHIQIDLQGLADKELVVKVTLTDISGRHIADLYEGRQAGLVNSRLALPAVTQGLYLVTVSSGSRQLKTEKIAIR